MNKTININLGGFPFTLDDIAYDLLDRYITSIKNHFAYSDSYQEIITDIEIRLGELLQEKTAAKQIVTTADVEFAIKIMGRPEEFGAESIDLPGEDIESNTNGPTEKSRPTRKLFRNMSDKKLGGVCSGLAAYFGIKNANWIRLAFLIFTTTGGFGIPLYIIMWIFIPEAKTSADYLAMKGEQVTVNNIAEYLEKEIHNFSSQLSDLTDDITGRFSGSEKKSFRAGGPAIDLEETIKTGAARLVSILKPLALIVGGFLLLCFAGIWISLIVGYVISMPFISYINSTSPLINFISSVNSFVILAVPLVFIVFWALRLVFKTPIHRSLRQSLLIFWLSNLICFIILGATTFKEYKNFGMQEIKQDLGGIKSDVVTIQSKEIDYSQGHIRFGDLRFGNDDKLEIAHDMRLNIYPAPNEVWSVTKKIKARGVDSKEAKTNASCIDYTIVPIDDRTLEIPSFFSINPDCKYRFQQVEVDLYVPVGKSIIIPQSLEWKLGQVRYDQNQMKDGWKYIAGKEYRMTEKGLICPNCTPEELKGYSEPEQYNYVSDGEIPDEALLQTTEDDRSIPAVKDKIWNVTFDKILSGGSDKYRFEKIELNVDQSTDSLIHIIRKFRYYGKRSTDNSQLENIYNYRQNGQEIIFSNVAFVPTNANVINPSIETTLLLPEGTKIRFDDSMNNFDGQIRFDKDEIPGSWRFVKNELLQMGAKGLKCINCN